MAQTRDSLSEVTWRNRTVPVKNSRVRTFLLANRDFNSLLDKCTTLAEKSDSLEQHLMDCKDAMLAIRDDIKTEQVGYLMLLYICVYKFKLFNIHFNSRKWMVLPLLQHRHYSIFILICHSFVWKDQYSVICC